MGSTEKIRQMISNLVANSIDATPKNGTLHARTAGPVTLNGKHPLVAFTIADTGSGIAPEHRTCVGTILYHQTVNRHRTGFMGDQ